MIMMSDVIPRAGDVDLQHEWYTLGEKYAVEVNALLDFSEKNGWSQWNGEEPEDKRDHLADSVIQLLRLANEDRLVDEFRRLFPPAHTPLIAYFEEKGQSIEQLLFVEEDKIVFVVGTPFQKRQAYLLNGKSLNKLDGSIEAVGKSKQNSVFSFSKHPAQ